MTNFEDITTAKLRDSKGLDAVRMAILLAQADGLRDVARDRFKQVFAHSPNVGLLTKATVPAGGPGGAWGDALYLPGQIGAALFESLPYDIFGRFPGVRVPFGVSTPAESVPFDATGWVGSGAARIVVRAGFTATILKPCVNAGIDVFTKEAVKLANVGPIRDRLQQIGARGVDIAFTDPTNAGEADKKPASITYNAPSIMGAGSPADADAASADLTALVEKFRANGGRLESAVFLLSSTLATALALSGHLAFAGLRRDGGVLGGVPALASDSVGDRVILVDGKKVLTAEDGADITLAEHAALEMSNTPTNNALTATPANLVSLFQASAVAFRVSRFVNWQALDGACAYIENANYCGVGAGSPV